MNEPWRKVPLSMLRNLLDARAQAAAASGKPFSAEEAALDLMVDEDRGGQRTQRQYAERWGWSKGQVSRALHSTVGELPAMAGHLRLTGSLPTQPERRDTLGQVGARLGQVGADLGQESSETDASGPVLGQVGADLGQVGARLGQEHSIPAPARERDKDLSHAHSARAREDDPGDVDGYPSTPSPPAVRIYREVFPGTPLSSPAAHRIASEARASPEDPDLVRWRETLEWWRDQHYRPESVPRILARYRETLTEAATGRETSQTDERPRTRQNRRQHAEEAKQNPGGAYQRFLRVTGTALGLDAGGEGDLG